MPGKRWTKIEKRSVREQIAARIPARNIVVENRSWSGIRYILRVLRIHWSNRWTRAQTRSLIAQIKQDKKLPDIRVENKSAAAINAKRRNLRLAGRLGNRTAPAKRKYTGAEVSTLERYGWKLGWSALKIYTAGVLANRSYHSISKKMGRLACGDPMRVQRAKQARRLSDEERQRFDQFLLTDGRKLSGEKIAQQFKVTMKVVNSHRRILGVPLSWHEARAASSTEEKRQRIAEVKRKHLQQRWAKYRADKIQSLLHIQQRLERRGCPTPIRTCRSCAYGWFALPTFFSVQRRRLEHRIKVSMSQTCRLCRMKLKQEKYQLQ
jgi:hypothetical protein